MDADDHVLRSAAGRTARRRREISALLDGEVFTEVLAEVPDEWLEPVPGAETPDAVRAAYVSFLVARLGTRQWLPGAEAVPDDRSSPTSTSSCAACRGSTGRSSSTSAW